MSTASLRFYLRENQRCHGILAYEWLLEKAKELGLHGGSAFRAIAGFGRHGVLHEDHFFELAGDLPVMVEFVLGEQDADRLLELARTEGLSAFYLRVAGECGVLNGHPPA